MQRTKRASVCLGIGFFLVGTALFADKLGLSLGADWNKSRIAILGLGFLAALIPWMPWKRTHEQAFRSDWVIFPALLVVLAAYFWFFSASHDSTSGYYSLLASSFREGKLSLALRPDPALLELPNPYDPAARQGIKAPLDLSLYKGKFYLYWGPAPALLVALAKPLVPGPVSDGYLLLLFLCGTFLLEFLLIAHIQPRFFPEMPTWMIILSILIAGLIHPTLWLLNRPKIYETAIAGGQFFFIAGLFLTISALDRPAPSRWRLILAGILWSLAVGTRSVLVFPILFMTLLVIIWFYRLYRPSLPKIIAGLLPLGIPLMLGAIAFGWYNWARFGSISETGFSYALAGPYLQKHLHELFLPAYTFQNLYNYLLHPFTIRQSFPFLYPLRGISAGVLPGQILPEIYSVQALTGILWAAPFTIFASLPAIQLSKQVFRKNQSRSSEESFETFSFPWILTSLTGSFLFSFTCLLGFFWAAMRYEEDFMPTLALLSIIGFWQAYSFSSRSSNKGKMYSGLGLVLAGVSILIGILLALSIYFTNGLL